MSQTVMLSLAVLGAMGLVLGLMLAVFSRLFAVTIDPRIEEVMKALPGLNCGVCGFAGCAAMAEAIVAGTAEPRQCPPGGAEAVKRVSAILGVAEEAFEPRLAVVRCLGARGVAKDRAIYRGVKDCVAEELIKEGWKSCVYGCLGMGTCVRACPFKAIRMGKHGLPSVSARKCTGCGKCVTSCPRGIIELIPSRQKVFCGCVSPQKGKRVRDACSRGCIACGLCVTPKVTPSRKVAMRGNLPEIPADWEDFAEAVEKCPAKCLVVRGA